MQKRQSEIVIQEPIEDVYSFITDWRNTPRYERYISSIELVEKLSDHQHLARSCMKFLGLRFRFLYRYWFSPATTYGGVQVKGLLRGGFSFDLQEVVGGTRVVHIEFIVSRWKWLERLAAFLFWNVLFPSDIQHQLTRLKSLVEGRDL